MKKINTLITSSAACTLLMLAAACTDEQATAAAGTERDPADALCFSVKLDSDAGETGTGSITGRKNKAGTDAALTGTGTAEAGTRAETAEAVTRTGTAAAEQWADWYLEITSSQTSGADYYYTYQTDGWKPATNPLAPPSGTPPSPIYWDDLTPATGTTPGSTPVPYSFYVGAAKIPADFDTGTAPLSNQSSLQNHQYYDQLGAYAYATERHQPLTFMLKHLMAKLTVKLQAMGGSTGTTGNTGTEETDGYSAARLANAIIKVGPLKDTPPNMTSTAPPTLEEIEQHANDAPPWISPAETTPWTLTANSNAQDITCTMFSLDATSNTLDTGSSANTGTDDGTTDFALHAFPAQHVQKLTVYVPNTENGTLTPANDSDSDRNPDGTPTDAYLAANARSYSTTFTEAQVPLRAGYNTILTLRVRRTGISLDNSGGTGAIQVTPWDGTPTGDGSFDWGK